jgi:signal transduction histidine kinase/CheY-like chemotaxis protein
MKHLSIKLQLSLIAIGTGFVLLMVQLGLQFYVLHSDIVQRIETNEYKQLNELAEHLDKRLQDSMAMLASVGLNFPAEQMLDREALEKLLQREHALLSVYDDVYVFDAKGILLVDWPIKPGRRALDMSSRDYIQGVIHKGQTVISKPLLGKATQQPIVVIASPIFDHEKKLVGILGGVLNLYKPNLLGSLASRKNGEKGYYYMVTQDRVRIAHPDPNLILKTIPADSVNIPLEKAFAGFEGTLEGVNNRGLKGLFTFKRLKSTDWIVASVIPSAEAFAPIGALSERMLLVTLLLMLTLLPLIWCFVARLVAPLQKLAQAMHNTAEHMQEGKVIAPMAELGSAEITTVVKAFNAFVEARALAEKDLALARDAAQAANASKSHFLANMSHEIRTPMNGILGMTELCLQTRMTSEQRSYLDMVAASAHSLVAVINDILDFSKIEAQKMHLDPHEFSMHSLIRQTTRTLSLRAFEKKLELVCDLSVDVPDWVVGDPLRLQQIMTNLLGNAIKFTAHGEVVLSVACMNPPLNTQGVWLTFQIQDTGIGISHDKQKLIFEVFTQADASTARRFGGSGLGLAISRSLVEMMGGDIQVRSQLGQGSTFSFNIQLQGVPSTPRPAPRLHPQLTGNIVLVVEDNARSRALLTGRLQGSGLQAVACNGAAQALHHPQWLQAHYALIDVNMPDIDGYALAAQLRHRRSAHDLVIIMMGALSEQVSADALDRLGIQSFLIKPVDPHELISVLNNQRSGHHPNQKNDSPPSKALPPAAALKRVLLAEDTPINQTLETILLNRMGYEVTLANHGLEAVEAFRNGTFDLILMDIQMPEMGGIEATQLIRDLEKMQGLTPTPIIAVTANALKGDRELYLASGMDGYVSKPISTETLKSEIQRLS